MIKKGHAMQIRYAIFASEQVIEIYEKEFPNDKRPRNAIEAAKEFLKDPSKENKNAANAANAAAYAAAKATYAANAAYAAANAAANAAYATYAANAANAAANAAYAAANATYAAATNKLKTKILKFGLKILGEK